MINNLHQPNAIVNASCYLKSLMLLFTQDTLQLRLLPLSLHRNKFFQ